MSIVELPIASPAFGRLTRLSRLMEIAISIGIVLIGGLALAAMIIPEWTRNIALAKLGEAGEYLPITPFGQFVAGIVLAVPVGVMIYGLLAAGRMFGEFARGEVFTESAAGHLRIFAAAVLAQAPLGPLTAAGFSAALSLANPPERRFLAIAFSTNDYFAFIVGGVLFVAATLMREAAKLDRENKSFV